MPGDFYARRAEQLEVGRGTLDLGAVVRPDLQALTLDVRHRLSRSTSLWGHAQAGRYRDRFSAAVMGGVRVRW